MLLIILAVTVMFFVAWNIGANNAANVMGIPVGSGALSLKNAVIIVFALEILGALLFGENVARTIGTGILDTVGMRMIEAVSILFIVGAFITAASYLRLPMSMTQVLVGCVAGYALATSSALNTTTLAGIALSWLFSPLLGIAFGVIGYYLIRKWFLSGFMNMQDVSSSFSIFIGLEIISASLVAFAQGANSIAAAVGIFSGVAPAISLNTLTTLKLIGGAGIGIGMATWGYRVIQTISSKIVAMNPAMCFTSQLSAAIVVLSFTAIGMPISCVHVVVGSVIGVGLISGANTVHWKVIYEIITSWIFILPISAFASYIFIKYLIIFI